MDWDSMFSSVVPRGQGGGDPQLLVTQEAPGCKQYKVARQLTDEVIGSLVDNSAEARRRNTSFVILQDARKLSDLLKLVSDAQGHAAATGKNTDIDTLSQVPHLDRPRFH